VLWGNKKSGYFNAFGSNQYQQIFFIVLIVYLKNKNENIPL